MTMILSYKELHIHLLLEMLPFGDYLIILSRKRLFSCLYGCSYFFTYPPTGNCGEWGVGGGGGGDSGKPY